MAQMSVSTANAWIALILGVIAVSGALFGVATFIVRGKDMTALRPIIEEIPLIRKEVQDQGKDIAELKGIMMTVSTLTTHREHDSRGIEELKARVLILESKH